MTGLGTLVNMAAILIGSGIGLLLKNGIPKRLQTTISSAVGLCVVFVGVTGAIKGLMNVSGTTFETKDTLVVVICMAIGAAIGECLDLEQRMENLGDWVKSSKWFLFLQFYRSLCKHLPCFLHRCHGHRRFH